MLEKLCYELAVPIYRYVLVLRDSVEFYFLAIIAFILIVWFWTEIGLRAQIILLAMPSDHAPPTGQSRHRQRDPQSARTR